jgi:pyruvate dehydrogenase E2 component (dihydrolipoamide acetyltransferase)
LSRPRPEAKAKPKPEAKAKPDSKTSKGKGPPPAVAKPSEDASALDAAAAAQVPTASRESSGISTSGGTGSALIGANQGEVREVIGRDGVKRKIRTVGPSL